MEGGRRNGDFCFVGFRDMNVPGRFNIKVPLVCYGLTTVKPRSDVEDFLRLSCAYFSLCARRKTAYGAACSRLWCLRCLRPMAEDCDSDSDKTVAFTTRNCRCVIIELL